MYFLEFEQILLIKEIFDYYHFIYTYLTNLYQYKYDQIRLKRNS